MYTVDGVFVWINGPFGGGKTQTAYHLRHRLPGAVVCDPEEVGFGLHTDDLTTAQVAEHIAHGAGLRLSPTPTARCAPGAGAPGPACATSACADLRTAHTGRPRPRIGETEPNRRHSAAPPAMNPPRPGSPTGQPHKEAP